MSKNRLEAFSDGVFAVIITILVLDMKCRKEPICMPSNQSFLFSNGHDDLAELVAWAELAGHLRQPYRILI